MNSFSTHKVKRNTKAALSGLIFVFAFGVLFNYGYVSVGGAHGAPNLFSLATLAYSNDDADSSYSNDEHNEYSHEKKSYAKKPACGLTVSDATIEEGESATVSWTSQHAVSGVVSGTGFSHTVTSTTVSSGSISVSPNTTTTYSATFTGEKGEVHCTTQIVVTKKQHKKPVCTLTGYPFVIDKGQKTELTWTTQNATSFSINQGVGSLTPVQGGDVEIEPTETTKYTGTATGPGGSVTCEKTITVNVPPPPAGKCEMTIQKSVDKSSVAPGGVVEYTIEFKNVGQKNCTGGGVKVVDVIDSRLEYVSESHASNVTGGYGDDPVYSGSTRTLRWNADTLVPGEEGWVKWKAKVGTPQACSETIPNKAKITAFEYDNFSRWEESATVNVTVAKDCTPPPTPVPICTLSASPALVSQNGTTTLSWTSAHATSGSINNGIGALATLSSGFATTTVATTTTYSATFTGPGGSVSCAATVTVPPPPVAQVPACTMTVSSGSISNGSEATLSWTGSNVTDLTIDQGIGIASTTASKVIKPSANTTYTGVFSGPHGTVTCQASISVTTGGGGGGGGGGGSRMAEPTVVLYQTPSNQPLAFVYLSQVPYTGFPATPLVMAIFWTALALFSAGIAYLVVFKGLANKIFPPSRSKSSEPVAVSPIKRTHASPRVEVVEALPENLPIAPAFSNARANVEPILEPRTENELLVEKRFADERILVSKNGMSLISSLGNETELVNILDKVIYTAKRNYPREDGWILLSDDRVDEVCAVSLPENANTKRIHPQATTTSGVAFLNAILDEEKEKLFTLLRSLSVEGRSVDELITDAVVILDQAFRARIEGGVFADQHIAARIQALSTKQLESLVEALTGGIDQAYSSGLTGAKLAVANALNLVSKWNQEKKAEPIRSPFVGSASA